MLSAQRREKLKHRANILWGQTWWLRSQFISRLIKDWARSDLEDGQVDKITSTCPSRKSGLAQIAPDSVVYTDCYRSYNALDVSDFHHHRINHSALFATGKNHINGIENFWNQAKRVLRKHNGIPKESFPLFLKECEFRFNYGTPKQQLTILKGWAEI